MREVIFTEGDFTLVKESGIGMRDTPWESLRIISDDNAEKHAIEIRLDSYRSPNFEGKPVKYTYGPDAVRFSLGVIKRKYSLAGYEEYFKALEAAVAFVRDVQKYIDDSDEWRA